MSQLLIKKMDWLSFMLPIILIVLLYIVYTIITYIRNMRNEAFENAIAARKYDIGTFLAARAMYDTFYNTTGKQLCKSVEAAEEEPLCVLYGGVIGPTYAYSPPILKDGNESASQRLQQQMQQLQLTDQSFYPIPVDDNIELESAVFTYYRSPPQPAGANKPPTFRIADEWQQKTDVERFIDLAVGVCRSASTSADGAAVAEYTCYIRVGGLNYRLIKDIGSGTQELLSIAKQDQVSRRPMLLYVACGIRAPTTYKQATVADVRLFEIMLGADSQNKLDGDLAAAATITASGSASGSGSSGSSGSGPAGTSANLQLPPLRYIEDGWIKNGDLFKQMYTSLKDPVASITNYYKSTNIANTNNSYINTLTKFVELDKRILKAAGVLQPKTKAGTSYKFLIPNSYDPALQLLGDNYEEPEQPAKFMKCYDLSQQEASLVNYFKRGRSVENPGVSAEELANKVQAAICASYGYYTSSTAEGACNCNGCCIPVNYKPRDGRMAAPRANRLAAIADDATAEILSKVDNCVHISQPFQLKRTGPIIKMAPTCDKVGLQTEEGFMELPANYGLTLAQAAIRDKFSTVKGAVIGGRDLNVYF